MSNYVKFERDKINLNFALSKEIGNVHSIKLGAELQEVKQASKCGRPKGPTAQQALMH